MNQQEFFEKLHQRIHESTHDPEDTVFLTVMQDEGLLLSMGILLVSEALPCMRQAIGELSKKMNLAAHEQHPEWYEAEEWGEHGA